MRKAKKEEGFSLIELMTVVAVIGILAGVALPNYNEYVKRSKVNEALSGLSQMTTQLEQYYQDNRTYVGACAAYATAPPNCVAASTVAPRPCPSKNFDFTCTVLAANTYTVTAAGLAGTQMAGFSYTIAPNNVRTTALTSATGWSGNGANCWVLNKGGGC
jgi:type IV pilus assembly protein PilE